MVFIHGIKGAELTDPDGNLAWLTASQALGMSSADIALPVSFEGGAQPRGNLKARGVLSEIPLFPGIYAVDVYGPFLEAAAKSGRPFFPFAYDWRRDNNETLAAFEAFVDGIAAKNGGKVTVVSHSMGGLLTLALLNKRPELFAGVVFAGVPFKGGIGFLSDLHIGAATGLNNVICGPAVLATFPSVFSLFPLQHESVLSVNRSPTPMDFFAAADWKRLKLGPFAEGRVMPPGYEAFLAEALKRSRSFREQLVALPAVAYPPLLVVTSKAHKTLVKVILGSRQADNGVDFTSAPMADGDGRVAYLTSLPPDGLKYESMETDEDHAALLNDSKVAARALSFP